MNYNNAWQLVSPHKEHQPTVAWNPSIVVQYPAKKEDTYKWKIFAQEDILIPGSNPFRKTI